MTNRAHRALNSTTAAFTGLLDASGNVIPASTIHIPSLPEIDRRALVGLPDDMEARLLQMPGEDPAILIIHAATELYMEMPLTDQANLAQYVAAIRRVVIAQSMGETPEEDGYRVPVTP